MKRRDDLILRVVSRLCHWGLLGDVSKRRLRQWCVDESK